MGSQPARPEPGVAAELKGRVGSACAEAATLISQADIFVLLTGAGFSADSGLAIYADVAKVSAYKERELQYHDLCQPHWLCSEPELFWGFWGQCFNDYRRTAPHPGYEILDRWVEGRFRHSEVAAAIRKRVAETAHRQKGGFEAEVEAAMRTRAAETAHHQEEEDMEEPYVVTDHAGGFFVYTSNVDAHHFDWFHACEIRECHGNTELYQCSSAHCPSGVWRAPLDFHFTVSKDSMLAPATAAAPAVAQASTTSSASTGEAPRIGHVAGEARTTTLRHMPGTAPAAGSPGFQTNHPMCPRCGQPARPAILMFSDDSFKDNSPQEDRFAHWDEAVEAEAKARYALREGPRLRIAIMEIGAGANVTTVRSQAESFLDNFSKSGAEVKLIRVNPDYPHGDQERYAPGGQDSASVISIMGFGLETIQRIDAALAAM